MVPIAQDISSKVYVKKYRALFLTVISATLYHANQDVSVIFLQFLNITLQNSDKYPPSHHVQAADGNS